MLYKFDKLFSVTFHHSYFAESHFNGIRVSPTKESQSLLNKYGLPYKTLSNGLQVYYETSFEGRERHRASLLKENITLQFRIDLADLSFYNYTGNIHDNPSDRVFWFSNLDENQQIRKDTDLLHAAEYVSEKDKKPLMNYKNLNSPPFGFIEIQFNEIQSELMLIRFSTLCTYWRYILTSEYLQKLEKPAIINKTTQKQFIGPEIFELPDGKKVKAFTSSEPIALTEKINKSFQLGDNYDPVAKHFETDLISVLPNPNINVASINNGDTIKISTIML